MLKSQLNCAKAQLLGIGGGFPTRPSISLNAPRIRLFLFRVVKPADAGPFCRSNRASSDVTQTTEVAWGEQLETHTHTHLAEGSEGGFLSWKLLGDSNTQGWILQAQESQPDGYSRVAGGAPQLGGWREAPSLCEVPASFPPFEEREGERAPFKPGVDGKGGGENRTRSVYDSTLCEGRLPWVSLQLSRVERSHSTDTNLFNLY